MPADVAFVMDVGFVVLVPENHTLLPVDVLEIGVEVAVLFNDMELGTDVPVLTEDSLREAAEIEVELAVLFKLVNVWETEDELKDAVVDAEVMVVAFVEVLVNAVVLFSDVLDA